MILFCYFALRPTPRPTPDGCATCDRVASASELLLYTLLFVQPLVGWGMLSAARYPIVLFGSVHLPPILPHSVMLYAALRRTHTVFAYLLFLTFIAHFGAVLFHTLIVRDGIVQPYGAVESPREVGISGKHSTPRRVALPQHYLRPVVEFGNDEKSGAILVLSLSGIISVRLQRTDSLNDLSSVGVRHETRQRFQSSTLGRCWRCARHPCGGCRSYP